MQERNTRPPINSSTPGEQSQTELPLIESAGTQTNKPDTQAAASNIEIDLPWYRHPLTMALITITIGLHVIFVMAYYAGEMRVKQSMVIVQHDSCGLLQQKGATIQLLENGSCKTEVRYLPNKIGTGGRIYMGDAVINIADHQIVGYVELEDQPYTPDQRQALMLFLGALLILSIFIGWTVYVHKTLPKEYTE